MSRRRNYRAKPASVATGEDSPVVAAFRQYARELDDKHDRHERLVKRSRDITIESKRIIFQLHSLRPRAGPSIAAHDEAAAGPDTASVLRETRERLDQLVLHNFAAIAAELDGRDAHQYVRAFSAGLQEFVEALAYWQYVAGERLSGWRQVEQMLSFEQPAVANAGTQSDGATATDALASADNAGNDVPVDTVTVVVPVVTAIAAAARTQVCPVDPMEFMQGIGDFSGEVMRQCVNALGAGHFDVCFRGCAMLRWLHTGFLGLSLNYRNRSLTCKTMTLRQSLHKVEHVCYNIKVRGRESGTLSLLADGAPDDDEGFSNF